MLSPLLNASSISDRFRKTKKLSLPHPLIQSTLWNFFFILKNKSIEKGPPIESHHCD